MAIWLADPFKGRRTSDRGSLTLFISTLFLLLLTISFGVINISSTSIAKHRLYQLGETAIQRAAHSISLNNYYSGVPSRTSAGISSVPIDCQQANSEFRDEVAHDFLYGVLISVQAWYCDGTSITGTISLLFRQPLNIPFLSGTVGGLAGGQSKIVVLVGASSTILS
jgi:hypothetical protein